MALSLPEAPQFDPGSTPRGDKDAKEALEWSFLCLFYSFLCLSLPGPWGIQLGSVAFGWCVICTGLYWVVRIGWVRGDR